MRTIHKKISLEQFKSRMPSIIPAYDKNGKQHNFTHFTDLLNEPIVNYGMLPFDIQIDENVNLGKYSGKIYSYQELVNIFHKLDNHFNKPIVNECQDFIELSKEDTQFYKWLSQKCFPFFIINEELTNFININDIKRFWGTNKLSIKEVNEWYHKMQQLRDGDCCDKTEYENRGGEVMLEKLQKWYEKHIKTIICNHQDYGHDFMYNVNDTDKIVKVKVIKNNEIDYHDFEIYEPRVRILGNNRYIKYGQIDKDGNVINPQIIEIINGVLIIPCLFSTNEEILIISEPSFSIPLLLTNSMSNMGEMTSICEDWEKGYEYNQNIENKDNINYDGGPMVYYNGDNWILKSYDNPGYVYSEQFHEIYFANVNGMTDAEYINYSDNENLHFDEQWERYFDFLPKIDNLELNQYTYKNNQIVLNPNPFIMGDKMEINTNNNLGYCRYRDNIYPIYECESIKHNSNFYEVFYVYQADEIKRNPYVFINGIKVFINKQNCSVNSNKQYQILPIKEYIKYDDILIDVSSLEKYDGVINYENENIFFKKNKNSSYLTVTNTIGEYVNKIDMINSTNNNLLAYTTFEEKDKWYVIITKPYEVYNSDCISGETTSKLNDLINNVNLAVDNLGNSFYGLMPYKQFIGKDKDNNTKYFYAYTPNPKPNDWLCIPFIPKHTNNLDEIEKNIYWGNIIEKVIISYNIETEHKINYDNIINTHNLGDKISIVKKNVLDTYSIIKNGKVECQMEKVNYTFTHICTEDEILKMVENILRNNYNFIKNITCNVEYYMGTIIQQIDNIFNLKLHNDKYYGVKYIDKFNLEKKQCSYHYDEIDICILNYWEMQPMMKSYNNEIYNIKDLIEPTSFFEFKIQPFELQYGYKLYNNNENFTFYKVNEIDKIIKYNNNEYPIEFINNKKCFSFPLNETNLYKTYEYFCIKNNEKIYAQYKNESFEIIIDNIKYQSNGMKNIWVDDEDSLLPYKMFCQIPIKLFLITPKNTSDNYFDYTNDMSISPLIFNENKLGQATQEKISGNIYIDRGTVRTIDYHLRLLEAKSLESLEQIGNGFFNFKSNNEVK